MTLPSLTSLSAVLFASELALAISKRAGTRQSGGHDRRSLLLLWVVIGLSLWAGFVLRAHLPAARLPYPLPCYLVGLTLFVLGLLIRWTAIIHLGRFFTVNVAIAEDHRLITTGPYRYVRHPSYTGSLLIFLGYGLCMLNFWSIAAVLIPIGLAFLWRVRVEEAALREAFGERYRAYAAKTPRLLPFFI